MKFWSVNGNTQALDGGAMFGNVPKAMWSRWVNVDESNRIPLACRALLTELDDGRRVLFETGIGAFFEPKLRQRFGVIESEHVLLNSLQEIGISHPDIDVVVLSHLHFDHAGGLLSAWQTGQPPTLLFPKARFLVSKAGWERACHPHARDRASFIPELSGLLQDSGRLEIVGGDASPTLGPQVRFEFSSGHTPGLMLSEIGGDGGIVFCADLIPGRPWVHLPITMGYDRFPEQLIDEKQRFLEDKLERGVRLFFAHDAEVAVATVTRDERGRFGTSEELPAIAGISLTPGATLAGNV
ncbi:MAG: MBL fold metallo-hydrolase [Gammaproteobacteria bacterium]